MGAVYQLAGQPATFPIINYGAKIRAACFDNQSRRGFIWIDSVPNYPSGFPFGFGAQQIYVFDIL
jgi:hypothetical protein